MLDRAISRIAEDLIKAELAERERYLSQESKKIVGETWGRNTFFSTATIDRTRRLCEDELRIRAELIVQQLIRVVTSAKIKPYGTLGEDFKEELKKYLIPEMEKLQHLVDDVARRVRALGRVAGETSLEEAAENAVKKAIAEIELFAAAYKQSTHQGGDLHVYGPVGAIQTGPGATAHVTQTIGNEEQQRLIEALNRIVEETASLKEVGGYHRQDIVDLIEEAKSEAKKDRPNMLQLRSALVTIAGTIQTVAALRPAYDLLKGTLALLGIFLP
jgi:hypothetical protein